METLVIKGGTSLKGTISVSGSKNAALPIIAATVLVKGTSIIKNVPDISDIRNLLKILDNLGAKTNFKNNTVTIDTTNIKSHRPDPHLVKHLRASIMLMGGLLARFKKVEIAKPGGCLIGARSMGTHLEAFKDLGAQVKVSDKKYLVSIKKLKGTNITLEEISVTGTENIVAATVLAEGKTEIRLAAIEPHVTDFCNFLKKMGAKIEGIGTHHLKIEGVKDLKPVIYEIIPDQIEAGTFAIAAIATRGTVTIENFIPEHHDILLNKFRSIGANFKVGKNSIEIKPSQKLACTNIHTGVYPGFPTDLQAPFAILLTQAQGTSNIFETMFEGRLSYLHELNKMGANAVIINSHEAKIEGPTPLTGTHISSLDLRAGATVIIASIIAEGTSEIHQAHIIDRGYEKIVEKLTAIGANIERKVEEIDKSAIVR